MDFQPQHPTETLPGDPPAIVVEAQDAETGIPLKIKAWMDRMLLIIGKELYGKEQDVGYITPDEARIQQTELLIEEGIMGLEKKHVDAYTASKLPRIENHDILIGAFQLACDTRRKFEAILEAEKKRQEQPREPRRGNRISLHFPPSPKQ